MIRTTGFFILIIFLFSGQFLLASDPGDLSLIPRPLAVVFQEGMFSISPQTVIVADGDETKSDAEVFNSALEKIGGFKLKIIRGDAPVNNPIVLIKTTSSSFKKDSYKLTVFKNKISIIGKDAGVFYGLQTVLQLIRKNETALQVPCSVISDEPRFPWRGMHLDVCRHFFPKEFVKEYIDLIAMYKMNTFHWHLTEDQGWRIEIKKYPKLTETGAWRSGSMVGAYSAQQFDTSRYGGFYTQDDIREIVAYATQRHVTVVPEIEMPGHSLAALAAYPDLSCTGGPFEVAKGWGVYDDVYCPKKETFDFLEDILTEVCELFPGKYIHIGGDECPKVRWKNCNHCQALMKKLKLKNENELQSYFIRHIEKFVNAKGRQIIGWDEILEGGLAPGAAVMSWRGTDGGVAAAKQHHQVVMTPGAYCYFDHYQGSPDNEPLAIGGYTTVEKVYSYDPVPEELPVTDRDYILGAQGNVWTEYILTPQQVEYMAVPRMCALAEVLWSPKSQRDYPDFQKRLLQHFSLLDQLKINYSKAIYELKTSMNPLDDHSGVSLVLSSPFSAGKIFYSLDGNNPTAGSAVYSSPVAIIKSCHVKAAYFEDGMMKGPLMSQEFFVSRSTGKKITLDTPPHENYFCSGAQSLVDGIRGDLHKHGQHWLGWWGPDMTATIDLGVKESFSKVTLDVFDDEPSWIYLPKCIEMLTSDDGINFTSQKKIFAEEIKKSNSVIVMNVDELSARYIKVIAKNAGRIPDGKQGSGNNSWLFVDEISVE